MISVVIPLYYADPSQYQEIERCFNSLTNEDIELIVVDDGSPLDADLHFPITIHSVINRGYTKTVNTGLVEATGDVIVVGNQDLVFTPELIERYRTIEDGIFSPMTIGELPSDRFGAIWGTTRLVLDELGLLDESLRHYFSDADYYNRAKKAGIPVTKWHDIVIEHQGNSAYKFKNKNRLYNKDEKTFNKKWKIS